jgi:type 1 fimbriae regulatory protein FimB/type 1 fimbriae regulatory protein FimE
MADGSGMPRSLDPPESGIRCGPKGQDERAAYNLSLSTILFARAKGVPFWARNGTAAPTKARLSAAIKRENETMPGTQNGTVRFAVQRPALRVVGEAVVPPRRQRNSERRPREYLTLAEVEMLITTARKRGRYGHWDATMILVAYRHGLRVSELCALTWDQVDFGQGLLHVTRLKHGVPSVHPLGGEELRALRRLRREQPEGRHLFQTERDAPMTPAGFRKTLARIGEAGALGFPVHPHMLTHAAGYKLANQGVDTRTLQHYLGHRNIQHTVRYTELSLQGLLAGLRRGPTGTTSGKAFDRHRNASRARGCISGPGRRVSGRFQRGFQAISTGFPAAPGRALSPG